MTIDASQAFRKQSQGKATLVCAYEDEEKCHRLRLMGALTYGEFLSQLSLLPRSQEIIFYCT